jgi:hypothetical protein
MCSALSNHRFAGSAMLNALLRGPGVEVQAAPVVAACAVPGVVQLAQPAHDVLKRRPVGGVHVLWPGRGSVSIPPPLPMQEALSAWRPLADAYAGLGAAPAHCMQMQGSASDPRAVCGCASLLRVAQRGAGAGAAAHPAGEQQVAEALRHAVRDGRPLALYHPEKDLRAPAPAQRSRCASTREARNLRASWALTCSHALLAVRATLPRLYSSRAYSLSRVCGARLAAAQAAVDHVAGEELHHDDGERVDVHGLGHAAVLEHLGRHVGDRAVRAGGHVRGVGLQHAAEPKVAHLRASLRLSSCSACRVCVRG